MGHKTIMNDLSTMVGRISISLKKMIQPICESETTYARKHFPIICKSYSGLEGNTVSSNCWIRQYRIKLIKIIIISCMPPSAEKQPMYQLYLILLHSRKKSPHAGYWKQIHRYLWVNEKSSKGATGSATKAYG